MTGRPSWKRFAAAVLVGAFAALLPDICMTAYELASPPRLLPDGTSDDNYTHFLVAKAVLLPVLYLVVALVFALIALVLRSVGRLHGPAFAVAIAAVSAVLCVAMGLSWQGSAYLVLPWTVGGFLAGTLAARAGAR